MIGTAEAYYDYFADDNIYWPCGVYYICDDDPYDDYVSSPSPSPSCVSGELELLLADDTEPDNNNDIHKKQVMDLETGDIVQGLDGEMNPSPCRVEAVGPFGLGPVYGNYTDDHFVLALSDENTFVLEQHGQDGPLEIVKKYDLITDCPVVMDGAGNYFASIDGDFCGGKFEELSWKDYVILHSAILRVIIESGPFWFHQDTYADMKSVKTHAPDVCQHMLTCVKDNENCHLLETAAKKFIDNSLVSSTRRRAYDVFHNIGSHNEVGSVSATVTGGESVMKRNLR